MGWLVVLLGLTFCLFCCDYCMLCYLLDVLGFCCILLFVRGVFLAVVLCCYCTC